MKKEYPRRVGDDNPIWYDDKCECGHGWEDHPSDWLFRRGKCTTCTCPKYILDKDNPSKRRLDLNKQQSRHGVEHE